MDWATVEDQNIQNPNAGNGGDLVKHTVYLSTIGYLLSEQPWKQDLRIRECHAGRGIYRLGRWHQWRNALSALLSCPKGEARVLLRDVERAVLEGLGCWPQSPDQLEWYAGSALLNGWALAQNANGKRVLDLYEKEPDTRSVLRGALGAAGFNDQIQLHVLPTVEDNMPFDGERYVEAWMQTWGKNDLVLLDPFARWRKKGHQHDRDLYASIIKGLVHRTGDSPSLLLFWTWGSASVQANEDLSGSGRAVSNGYQQLLGIVKEAGFQIVLVEWHWGYVFAMWIVVPTDHVRPIQDHVRHDCSCLSNHLRTNGQRWEHPEVCVRII